MTKSKANARRPPARRVTEPPASPRDVVVSTKVALLVLGVVTVVTYARVFGAAFVEYDDDVHVYANPFLNPVSFEKLGQLWLHAYHGLYIPLAYSIFGAIVPFAHAPAPTADSVGHVIALSPEPFHFVSVVCHLGNAALCFLLVRKLTRRRVQALLAALWFAVHPLQVESVAWVSELRGLSSACFGLGALNLFVLARELDGQERRRAQVFLGSSALLLILAMLCKPAAAVLPVVALIIDRASLGTSWRRALAALGVGLACVLPFVLITRAVQPLHPEGTSLWWQRPFVAGDALAFSLFKTVVPLELGVEYGRTPRAILANPWTYVAWAIPAGLLGLAYVGRRRRPHVWLGALVFVAFSLPTSGLVPFAFQAHSTAADRYAYLPMLGSGLIFAELVVTSGLRLAVPAAAAVLSVLALRSFDQTSYFGDNVAFLLHTLDVNPDVAFAHNNLGNIAFKERRFDSAIAHYEKALELDPTHALAQNNLGLALVEQGRQDEAEPHFRKAVELDPKYARAHENLGALYLRTSRLPEAIRALRAAVTIQPADAEALNNLGIAYMQSDQNAEGLESFQRAVASAPDNPQYRKNLGLALSELGRKDEAAQYLTR